MMQTTSTAIRRQQYCRYKRVPRGKRCQYCGFSEGNAIHSLKRAQEVEARLVGEEREALLAVHALLRKYPALFHEELYAGFFCSLRDEVEAFIRVKLPATTRDAP